MAAVELLMMGFLDQLVFVGPRLHHDQLVLLISRVVRCRLLADLVDGALSHTLFHVSEVTLDVTVIIRNLDSCLVVGVWVLYSDPWLLFIRSIIVSILLQLCVDQLCDASVILTLQIRRVRYVGHVSVMMAFYHTFIVRNLPSEVCFFRLITAIVRVILRLFQGAVDG